MAPVRTARAALPTDAQARHQLIANSVQGIAQLVNFSAALPRGIAGITQVHAEREDQLIAYPGRIASSQLN
jgi:hypothetical protein